MTYLEWEQSVPDCIKQDSVWKSKAYRLSLFAADLCWYDATRLLADKRTISLADQLFRSSGGISANIEEGYSRGTGRDRARFYEYGLGSARESRGWYHKGHHVLGKAVSANRMALLTETAKLLITMVPSERGQVLREESVNYWITASEREGVPGVILENVPMP
jgi:four helix bundle protein